MEHGDAPRGTPGFLARAWSSATLMTWLSVAMRALSVLVVLPLLLTRFPVEEIAVWYLFVTLIGLQQLADLGFAPTFVRVIAYAMGGATQLRDMRTQIETRDAAHRWDVIERIWQTMGSVYRRLTTGSVLLFAVVGTLAVRRPIESLADPLSGWFAWGVVIATFVISLQANAYSAYLQGVNRIAVVRRWETAFSFAAMISSLIVLAAGGRLLALVVSNQVWVILNAARNWWLSRTVEGGRAASFRSGGRDPEVMDAVWASAIRSGLGVIFSRGVIFSSGIIYAQVADSAALAAYLVAFRVMQMVMDFSNAPFYSKLPLLSTLRSQGREREQIEVAGRGMRLAYWSYVCGVIAVGIVAPIALHKLQSNAAWVAPSLWSVMAVAFFVERFGAMHIQLYSTTNHIIWHTANGVSGVIYLLASFALLPVVGVYAFPLGILIGYLSFYSWYAPLHVRRAFTFDFWQFQRTTVLAPCLVLCVFVAVSWFVEVPSAARWLP